MEEDKTDVVWIDRVWLSYFPLNEATALEYFSLSQFYDRSCNNEIIKMQRLDPALKATMEGIEYDLVPQSAPNLFVISKQRRAKGPTPSVSLLAIYYILNGNIYQAPTAHSVISSRVLQSLYHLRTAFDAMQAHALPSIASASTSSAHWKPPPGAQSGRARNEVLDGKVDAGALESRAMSRILFDVLDKNRRMQDAAEASAKAYAAEGDDEALAQ